MEVKSIIRALFCANSVSRASASYTADNVVILKGARPSSGNFPPGLLEGLGLVPPSQEVESKESVFITSKKVNPASPKHFSNNKGNR